MRRKRRTRRKRTNPHANQVRVAPKMFPLVP